MTYYAISPERAQQAENDRRLLTEIAAKHKAFTTIDTEYIAALERKANWRWDEEGDTEWGSTDYPHEYEITQWQLKRDIAERELQLLLSQIESSHLKIA